MQIGVFTVHFNLIVCSGGDYEPTMVILALDIAGLNFAFARELLPVHQAKQDRLDPQVPPDLSAQ